MLRAIIASGGEDSIAVGVRYLISSFMYSPAAPTEDDAALLATIVAEHARLAALHEHRGPQRFAPAGLTVTSPQPMSRSSNAEMNG